jgi:DNA-binding FadR family transcriptional regulator
MTKRRSCRALSCVLLGSLAFSPWSVPAGTAAAADAPAGAPLTHPGGELADNAALRYWPAFNSLPSADSHQEQALENWRTAPLDSGVAKLLDSSANSLRYLHDGAKQQRCDWGLEYEQGFELLLPHLQKARNLARLAALHARQRVEKGQTAEAADELADTLTLGRHAAPEGITIAILVRYAIEGIAIETAADQLPRLKPADLDRLAERIEKLPSAATAKDSVRMERDSGLTWVLKKVRGAKGDKDFVKHVVAMLAPPSDNDQTAAMTAAITAAGGTPESVAKAVEETGPFYDQYAEALALPYNQIRPRLDEISKKAQANPIAKAILPNYDKVVDTEARAQCRLAMLKAAIAVAKGGPDKVKDFPDPYGDGPFEYRGLPQGFELRSKLQFRGDPVVLQVGQPPKKADDAGRIRGQ